LSCCSRCRRCWAWLCSWHWLGKSSASTVNDRLVATGMPETRPGATTVAIGSQRSTLHAHQRSLVAPQIASRNRMFDGNVHAPQPGRPCRLAAGDWHLSDSVAQGREVAARDETRFPSARNAMRRECLSLSLSVSVCLCPSLSVSVCLSRSFVCLETLMPMIIGYRAHRRDPMGAPDWPNVAAVGRPE
jgi:hypothetical protein